MQAQKLVSEESRLAALYRYDILDGPIETEFDDITRLISQVCDVPIAVINLIDRDRQWFVSEVGLGVRETPLDISICAHAILQEGLFIVDDTLEDPRFADNPLVTGEPHLRYYAGELLQSPDGHPLGTLCVLDYQPRLLTDLQKEMLRVLAAQVMKQLELRRMLNEQEHVMTERETARAMMSEAYAREKRIAETLQRSFLLDIHASSFTGLDVCPIYEAAWDEADVGGDFYDVFRLDDESIAIVLGDVAGKGIDAAARTAEVKYALRAFLQEHPYPARTLSRLNDFLCNFHSFAIEDAPRFVCAVVGVVNIQNGVVLFANAGAESPVILRADKSSEVLEIAGMPLGIQSGVDYDQITCALGYGDDLLLCTDGITESRNKGKFLGIAGFAEIARNRRGRDLSEWAHSVLADVKCYSGGNLHDDVCILIASRAA